MPLCLGGSKSNSNLEDQESEKGKQEGVGDKMSLKDSLHMTYFFQLDPTPPNFQNVPQITLPSGDLGFSV